MLACADELVVTLDKQTIMIKLLHIGLLLTVMNRACVCFRRLNVTLTVADSYGKTPAYMAARDGHESCLLLLEAGCDLGQADDYGETPAYMAVKYGHEACLRVLIEAWCNLDKPNTIGHSFAHHKIVTVTQSLANHK